MASDFIVDLEKNLSDFTTAYSAYERQPTDDSQTVIARIEKFLTDQVFSVVSDEKLYRSALETVNRHGKADPAAIADLGMKLEVRWEHDYLSSFYRIESKRRDLFEIPANAVLVVGGLMMGSRHVANPAVVGRYFYAIQKLWMGMSAASSAGAMAIDYKLVKEVPPPPATLITVAAMDQLDYRASEASNAQHRRFMARLLGVMASSEMIGVGLQAAAEKPTPVAAVIILGVLAGSWYVGQSVEELSDWSFAWADDFQLENDAWEALFEMGQSYTPRTKTWVPDFLVPRYKRITKFEALRQLADAVLKLEAHRDLNILLAEMNLEDRLDAIAAKYGPSPEIPQKKAELAHAFATYRVTLRKIIGSRKGPLLDPMMSKRLARQYLRQLDVSPFVPSERQELRVVLSGWPASVQEAARHWVEMAQPSSGAASHDDALRFFRALLDKEEVSDQATLARAGYDPVNFHLSHNSDGLFLQAAAYVRSFRDPSIAFVADLFENRATHYAELLLQVKEGAQ
jgi:hypothetical protein